MGSQKEAKSNYQLWLILGVIALVICVVGGLAWLVIATRDANSTNTTEQPCSNPIIKGNISQSGEKIYHKPGDKYYSQTEINESAGEKLFCTEKDAQDAGWRHSKV